jgi:putative transposase
MKLMDSKVQPQNIASKKKIVLEYVIEETLIKVGSLELVWIWIVIELESKEIVGIAISKERKLCL